MTPAVKTIHGSVGALHTSPVSASVTSIRSSSLSTIRS